MKAVLLAGGLGSRIAEETTLKPKPMIEIGGKPMLWHIMKSYAAHGVNDFVICCGYKGYLIKEYFANHFLHLSDVTFDMARNTMEVHQRKVGPWRVTLVDTGENSMTGGRLKRVAGCLQDTEAFCCTDGDGVADIGHALLIPEGFAHGFRALSDDVEMLHLHSAAYAASAEGALPNFVVLLPWNLRTELMRQLDCARGWDRRFVTAEPALQVLP